MSARLGLKLDGRHLYLLLDRIDSRMNRSKSMSATWVQGWWTTSLLCCQMNQIRGQDKTMFYWNGFTMWDLCE